MHLPRPLAAAIPLLWAAMLWPALPVMRGLAEDGWDHAEMMHLSGVWSAYLLGATLAVTPATLVLGRLGRGLALARWLMRARRHLGLGAFVHASLHVAHYAVESGGLAVILAEVPRLDMGSGWVAFGIFALLAATSNDAAVRRLGRRWKRLHRWTYPAAAAVALHWWLFDDFAGDLALWAGAVLAAKLAHGALRRLPRRRGTA